MATYRPKGGCRRESDRRDQRLRRRRSVAARLHPLDDDEGDIVGWLTEGKEVCLDGFENYVG